MHVKMLFILSDTVGFTIGHMLQLKVQILT